MVQTKNSEWKGWELILFRFFFIYFIIQAVPLFDWKFYRNLFSLQSFEYRDIFVLSRFQPSFLSETAGFADWGIIALVALVGTIIWNFVDKKSKEYNNLYYWLRVILRYRLAWGVIAYGFLLFFPMQAPQPSISNLNTNYGDFSDWKLFSLTLGIVPSYQSFLGFVEILAGTLLLFRRTVLIGLLIILPFLGNIFFSNLAYEGGEYVYSFYLVAIGVFLLAFDASRLLNLLAFEKPTLPNLFKPAFSENWQKNTRIALKATFFLLFFGWYGFQTFAAYQKGSYHFPEKHGLDGAAGIYHVSEFKINNRIITYSKTDPYRWQDVVFEKWTTLSIKSNRPVTIEKVVTEEIYQNDPEKNYEFSGSGGRHYFSYTIDSTRQVLTLQNRNKNHKNEKLTLHYSRPDNQKIVLQGINENQDSVYVLLERINKKYLLDEAKKGRSRGLKL
ncbi:MAG: DoxX family protein [Verrucomicrobia bacterium]|nr:DoxX family protein [Cytophagales bacterium]